MLRCSCSGIKCQTAFYTSTHSAAVCHYLRYFLVIRIFSSPIQISQNIRGRKFTIFMSSNDVKIGFLDQRGVPRDFVSHFSPTACSFFVLHIYQTLTRAWHQYENEPQNSTKARQSMTLRFEISQDQVCVWCLAIFLSQRPKLKFLRNLLDCNNTQSFELSVRNSELGIILKQASTSLKIRAWILVSVCFTYWFN